MIGSSTKTMPTAEPDLAVRRKPTFLVSLSQILTGQLTCGAIALATEIVYARLLGPAARGTISVCMMSIAFAALIGGLGGESSIVFWSARANRNHSPWLPAVILWGVLGTIFASGLWILGYWRVKLPFLRGISPASAWLVLANIPAAILFAYLMAFLAGTEEFRWRSWSALLRQTGAILGCLLFLMLAGRTPEAALWGSLVAFVLASAATLLLVCRDLRGSWRIANAVPNLKPTLVYGLRGHIGNLATFFTYRLDVFVVNYFLLPTQLGFYALGVAISEALWQIPQAVASALFPRTARTQAVNGADSTRFSCFILRQVSLLTLFLGILIAAASPLVVPLVFGVSFKPSVLVVFWILPGTVALSIGKVACSDLAGRGKNGYSSVFALICFAITIALDWLLIPRYGIVGAAIASSIAYFIDTVLILIAVRHELRVTWAELLIPNPEDLDCYRGVWSRAANLFSAIVVRKTSVNPDFPSAAGE